MFVWMENLNGFKEILCKLETRAVSVDVQTRTHICFRHSCSHTNLTIDTHIHTHTAMSYSHLRGCWFSEMLQVRCHVHRSPGSKLRPLCFPIRGLLLSLAISFYLFSYKHAFMWLYSRQFFSTRRIAASSPVRACNTVSSVLFIISNNRAITQVSIWAAALYESHPVLRCASTWGGPGMLI